MTCQEFDDRFAAYHAGTLAESACLELERHAAECAVCEAQLESRSGPLSLVFAPPLPPDLRARTLAAIASHGYAARSSRWMAGVAAIAAAAVLVVLVRPREKQAQHLLADSAAVAVEDARGGEGGIAPSSPGGLAVARARPEFTALDSAARELREALVDSPDDAGLRAFLTSVDARRAELERRVKEARS
jgi:hypothetical protein